MKLAACPPRLAAARNRPCIRWYLSRGGVFGRLQIRIRPQPLRGTIEVQVELQALGQRRSPLGKPAAEAVVAGDLLLPLGKRLFPGLVAGEKPKKVPGIAGFHAAARQESLDFLHFAPGDRPRSKLDHRRVGCESLGRTHSKYIPGRPEEAVPKRWRGCPVLPASCFPRFFWLFSILPQPVHPKRLATRRLILRNPPFVVICGNVASE